jgi:hypothetical protein
MISLCNVTLWVEVLNRLVWSHFVVHPPPSLISVADDGGVVDHLTHAVHHEHNVRDVRKAICGGKRRNKRKHCREDTGTSWHMFMHF